MYLNGLSMKKIADIFNLKSIPTKQNKIWGSQTVSMILKNPLYCGFLHWEDYLNPGDHDPIVDRDTFNEIQELRQKRNTKTCHNSKIFTIPNH